MNKDINIKEYIAPSLSEHDLMFEGVVCASGTTNESYPGVPGDDETIF